MTLCKCGKELNIEVFTRRHIIYYRCPKCGYEDLPCWRYKRWTMFTSYTHKNDLDVFDPELLAKIIESQKSNQRYCDEHYRYRLTKSGHIHRIAHKDCFNPSNKNDMHEPPQEKLIKAKYFPNQRKLLELQE